MLTPPIIPLKTRQKVALGILGLLAFQFALVSAANGVVYLPGKSGGVFLSGLAAALVVLSCLTLSTALMLRVTGHRHHPWLAAHYHRLVSGLGWGSAALFLAGLLMALLGGESPQSPSWRLDWFDLNPPTVAGWMANTPLNAKPSTQSFLLGFGLLMLSGLWALIHPASHASRITGLLCGVSLVVLGGVWLAHLLFEISAGQFQHLRLIPAATWSEATPAGFQAVAATLLTLAWLTLLMGLFMVTLACIPSKDRISEMLPIRPSGRRPGRRRRRRASRQ